MTKPQPDYEQVLRDAGMPTTEEEVSARFTAIAKDEGLVTNTSRMSPFWRLITAIVTAPAMWIKDVLVQGVLTNMFLATATGQMLRLLAWGLNVTPKPATAASGVVMFYKTDDRQDVTVPAGSVVQTERINGVVYSVTVTEDTLLAAGSGSGPVPVTANGSGSDFNLAPGYYRILPVALDGIAGAVNEEDWLTAPGADEESDDELRDRCRNQFNAAAQYHIDAVYRGMVASVAGISVDRVFFLHDAPRGPGTANVYLLLDTGEISDPFISAVNDYVTNQGYHGHGDDLQCFPLPDTRHSLVATLYVLQLANITPDELAAIKTEAENLIRCAFRENNGYAVQKTWPYSRFSFSQLGRELHENDRRILSVTFSLDDIISGLDVPRLDALTVEIEDDGIVNTA
ncbi:baseplate J/gp47 family protein [Lelliottia aquatilis]|uniref:baseplate J/gp47 family protein n=1 Tax=Lelliottia aquatilis TaxID=2080838 RepID=UPI00192B0D22|nr:baseplate J/gp47 family protein [Lelliottia aquatilis]MBL5884859.1 baseplate J/gp47 family protein [Lelliottia aquatilis]